MYHCVPLCSPRRTCKPTASASCPVPAHSNHVLPSFCRARPAGPASQQPQPAAGCMDQPALHWHERAPALPAVSPPGTTYVCSPWLQWVWKLLLIAALASCFDYLPGGFARIALLRFLRCVAATWSGCADGGLQAEGTCCPIADVGRRGACPTAAHRLQSHRHFKHCLPSFVALALCRMALIVRLQPACRPSVNQFSSGLRVAPSSEAVVASAAPASRSTGLQAVLQPV